MPALITIEGIEGCGKSTLLARLADDLRPRVPELLLTRNPGATAVGRAIRELVLDPRHKGMAPLAELLLFAADRAQHVAEVIRPALQRGAVVLCDRYTHSTVAYQGYGRGLPLDQIDYLNNLATGGLDPDLVLLLDIEPELGLTRAKQRSSAQTGAAKDQDWNRFERQQLEFHRAIRRGFLEMAQQAHRRIAVIDAARTPEAVLDEAREIVLALLRQLGVLG